LKTILDKFSLATGLTINFHNTFVPMNMSCNLAVYYMSSTILPACVLEMLEARWRAFLWTGEEKCHGSKCLLAWERVCRTKENVALAFGLW
jgi:hypothetical protein